VDLKELLPIKCCGYGSGIRCLIGPWIRDSEKFFSRSWIPDLGSRISNPIFLKISVQISIPDPQHVPKWAGGMWVIGVSLEACKEHFTRNYLQISKIGAVLRILDVYPGSDFFTSRILDPNCLLKMVLWSRKQCCGFLPIPDPGSKNSNKRERWKKLDVKPSGSGIRKKPIPDPGVKKAPDPGTGSATLLENIIRVVHPESEQWSSVADPGCLSHIRLFSIPNPGSELSPKKWFLCSRKYDTCCSSRIRMQTFYPFQIQGSKRHRISDPGFRIRKTGVERKIKILHWTGLVV